MSSPSPKYVALAAEELGLPEDVVLAVASHLMAEFASRARVVTEMDGSTPRCSLCARHPALCKHIPDTKEADRG